MAQKFADNSKAKKLFWVFVIGSIFGTYYEELLTIVWSLIEDGVFYWAPRRGVLWGPFSPIYGFGAVLMTLALVNDKDKWYTSFIKAGLIGGIFEYLVSYFQEKILHTVAWDYSGFFLNIGGRTTVPYMVAWGALGVLFTKVFYPKMNHMIESIPVKTGNKLTKILLIFLIFDISVSWSALIRQTMRKNDIPPYTIVEKFYDKYFPDEYLHRHFPNTINR